MNQCPIRYATMQESSTLILPPLSVLRQILICWRILCSQIWHKLCAQGRIRRASVGNLRFPFALVISSLLPRMLPLLRSSPSMRPAWTFDLNYRLESRHPLQAFPKLTLAVGPSHLYVTNDRRLNAVLTSHLAVLLCLAEL